MSTNTANTTTVEMYITLADSRKTNAQAPEFSDPRNFFNDHYSIWKLKEGPRERNYLAPKKYPDANVWFSTKIT